MIVLDTNVISEVVKPLPTAAVIEWLNDQDSNDLFVTTVTLGEIYYGIEALPARKRRTALTSAVEQFIDSAFGDRVLGFDRASARIYGQIMAERRRLSRPMSAPNGQIAAVARSHNYQLATRNTSDFEECGLDLTNPFNPDESQGSDGHPPR